MLQAAWGILLGRLTGRDDVVFGVTVSGRPPEIAGIETMVGLFINTLPLRLKLPPAKPLRELLKELQDSQSGLIAHQHLGLAEIQALLGVGELFDTLIVFENYPIDRSSLAAEARGVRLAHVEGHDAAHYPLSLAAIPGPQLQLRFDYQPDLFDRGSVEALAGRLIRLLEAVAADPEAPIGRLDILSPDERHTILRDWNDTARAVPAATLPELFEAQAGSSPDATAVVFEDSSLSYAELNARANQLAHHLRALGVGPEVLVGLCVERSLECWSGCSASSRPAAPTCRSTPPIRSSASTSCCRTHAPRSCSPSKACSPSCPHDRPHTVCLDRDWDSIQHNGSHNPDHITQPHNVAYVIYTSGSTGTPKGVVVNLNSSSTAVADRHFAETPDSGVCERTSLRSLRPFDLNRRCCRSWRRAGVHLMRRGRETALTDFGDNAAIDPRHHRRRRFIAACCRDRQRAHL